MTPRLPSKRRSKDDGGRPSKKANEEPTYETFDEAMEGGVEMEEKAERYRDGEKAQRFYEQARNLYQKAMQLNEEDYGACYNLARVQYILASQFALPDSNLDLYSSAISLYGQAMNKTTSRFQKGDAAFNLAQALASLADVTDELEGAPAAEASREFRQTALSMLTPLLSTQVTWLRKIAAAQGQDEGEADPEASSLPAEGTAAALASDEKMEVEEKADEGDKIEVDGEEKTLAASSSGPSEEDLENQPTPDALVDTVLLAVDITTTMWETMVPPQMPSDAEQESTREMIESGRFFGPANRESELDLAETRALLIFDSIMWELYRDKVQPDTKMETSGRVAIKALERILETTDVTPPADPTLKASILAAVANAHASDAQRCIALAAKFPQSAGEYGTSAWTQLSSAAGQMNAALKLPTSAQTPKEFRPNCYLELLKNTLARARLAPINETAARNAQALLDNCSAYGAKAADALGWNLPRLPSSKTGMTPFYSPALAPPYPAGWDMEMLARDTALTLLRVCFFASQGAISQEPGTTEMYEMAAKSLLDALAAVRPPRRVLERDIRRFVGDIEDEEWNMADAEKGWWEEVARALAPAAGVSAAEQAIQNMFGDQ